jgi:hypothetical protein
MQIGGFIADHHQYLKEDNQGDQKDFLTIALESRPSAVSSRSVTYSMMVFLDMPMGTPANPAVEVKRLSGAESTRNNGSFFNWGSPHTYQINGFCAKKGIMHVGFLRLGRINPTYQRLHKKLN